MLTISRAKALQGKLSLPPSPDVFLVAAAAALACRRSVRIHPVNENQEFARWISVFEGCTLLSRDGDSVTIDPCAPERAGTAVVLPDDRIPYRDMVLYLALGARGRVLFRSVPEARLAYWQNQSRRIGFTMEIVEEQDARGIALSSDAPAPALPPVVNEDDILPLLGLLCGLRVRHSFQIDCTLSTPLRSLFASLGHPLNVQRDIGEMEKDPLVRRMRIKARQRLSSQEQLFTVTADFSAQAPPPEAPADLLLPGDEVLLALFLTGKSLIPRGSFIIDNAPLDTWAVPVTALMHKMGAKHAQQETHAAASGPAGIMSIQKFELTGQKTDFAPHFFYASQLPAMSVLAAFSEGQSLFRKFEDMRLSDPDGIRQLETCLRIMGVKFGDIPDGFVIKGKREHDGFDLVEPFPAPVAGAFAMAGLHCVGSSTVNDEFILKRWPDFSDMVHKLFEFK